MSIQAVAWALEQSVSDPAAKLVLISLANAYNQQRHRCFPTVRQIMKEAGISEMGARRKVKLLAEMGLIRVEKSFDETGRQQSNEYILSAFGEGTNLIGGGYQPDRGEGTKGDRGEGTSCDTPLKVPEETPEETSLGASAPIETAPPAAENPAASQPDPFDAFWALYPKRDGPNPRKPAKAAFERALKRGVPLEAIMGAVANLRRRHPKPTQFCPQTTTWLNQDRFDDDRGGPAPKPGVVETDEMWNRALAMARVSRKWMVAHCGRAPGHPDCRVPAHLLRPGDGDLWFEYQQSVA